MRFSPFLRTTPAWAAAGVLVAGAAFALPVTWPADAAWLELAGSGSTDPIGDSIGSRDIVGDAADPVAQVARDADHLFLRIRVSADPLQNETNFSPFGWVCFVDTDGELTSFEYKISLDGVANPDELILEQNTVQGTPNDFDDAPELTLSTVVDPLAGEAHARVVPAATTFGGTPDFFIDLALELVDLTASGFDPAAPLRITCGSSNNGGSAIADSTATSLEDAWGDPVECDANGCGAIGDSDGDGIDDATEGSLGLDPNDADSDDDGVQDGQEPDFDEDTDGDGLINAADTDSDNDGLADGTELGVDCMGSPDTDLTVCIADGDDGATVTSPIDADTDDGGVNDGAEDANLDGVIDAGETNPTVGNGGDDAQVVDTDGDGLSDPQEVALGTDPNDADSDDDGAIDGQEPNPAEDTDGNGVINALDPDSDGDGLFDGTELGLPCSNPGTDPAAGFCTADGDAGATTTSPLLPDTDGGSVSDGTEDTDRDGVVDPGERDPNDGGDDLLCDADDDCGIANDGLVCDALLGLCIDGCRNVDGAFCPAGFECTSLDLTIGVCMDIGGAGGGGGAGQGGAGQGGAGGAGQGGAGQGGAGQSGQGGAGQGGQGGAGQGGQAQGGSGQGGDGGNGQGAAGQGGFDPAATASVGPGPASSSTGTSTTSGGAGGDGGGSSDAGIVASGNGFCTVSAPGASSDRGGLIAVALAALGMAVARRRRR